MKRALALILALLLIGSAALAEQAEQIEPATIRLGCFSFNVPQRWYYEEFTTGDNILYMFFAPDGAPHMNDPLYIEIMYAPQNKNADIYAEHYAEGKRDKDNYTETFISINDVPALICSYTGEVRGESYSERVFACGYGGSSILVYVAECPAPTAEGQACFDAIVESVEIDTEHFPASNESTDAIDRLEADSTDTANSADSQTGTPSDEFTAQYCTYTLDGPYLYKAPDGDYIAVFYDWINTDDKPRDDFLLVTIEAYQNGHSLENDWPEGFWNKYHDPNDKYMPGYGGRSFETFKLEDNSEITILVSDAMDVLDKYDKVTITTNPNDLTYID